MEPKMIVSSILSLTGFLLVIISLNTSIGIVGDIIGIICIIAGLAIRGRPNNYNKSQHVSTAPKLSDQPQDGDSTYKKMLTQAHDFELKENFAEASIIYQNLIDYCDKKGWAQAKEWAEKSKHFADLQK